MIVSLKATYILPGGARCYPGERVHVDEDEAKRLIAQNSAEAVRPAKRAPAHEAIVDPASLRGEAKKNWLRLQITQKGGVPRGNTIKALIAQLEGMD